MLQENRGVTPGLAALLVGDDPVSQTYVSLKEKDCGKVGFVSRVYKMFDYPPETREKEVLNLLRNLNNDPDDGSWQYNYLIYDGRDFDSNFGPLLSDGKSLDTVEVLFCPRQTDPYHSFATAPVIK